MRARAYVRGARERERDGSVRGGEKEAREESGDSVHKMCVRKLTGREEKCGLATDLL